VGQAGGQTQPLFEVFWVWLNHTQHYWVLLGSKTQHRCSFWKCFGPGLAAGPNSIESTSQARPSSFWQSRQCLYPQFLTKKKNTTGERHPPKPLQCCPQ